MTKCNKKVVRATEQPCHRGRRLVVAIEPHGVISVREERRRAWYSIPIEDLYVRLVKADVERKRAERRKERKAKSSTRRKS